MRLLALAMLLGLLCYTQAAPSKARWERILQLLERARGGRPGGPPGWGYPGGPPPGLLDSGEDDDDDGDDSDPRGGGRLIMTAIDDLEDRVAELEGIVFGSLKPEGEEPTPPPGEEPTPPPEEDPTPPPEEDPTPPPEEDPTPPPPEEEEPPPARRKALKRYLYKLLNQIE